MKTLYICVITCLLLMSLPAPADALIKQSLVGSVGVPRGEMDYSANASWRISLDLPAKIDPEFRLAGSFSSKSSLGTRSSMVVGSAFCLGRIELLKQLPKLSPYIAAGPGLHYIYSISSENASAVEFYDANNSVTLLKAHVFVGCDFNVTPKLFITVEGRATFPSDIVIDSGYLGLGLKI